MEEPPARKPTHAERYSALRQQARAGDPVAQVQVDALTARHRAAAAKAKAAGRLCNKRLAQRRVAEDTNPAEAEVARQRQEPRAAAQRKREAAAAKPPKPVLSAEAEAARLTARSQALNRASYRALKQRVAAGDPEAVAKYAQRLAKNRQRAAANANPLTAEQRSESARQRALKRWRRSELTPEQRSERMRKTALKRWGKCAAPSE